MSKLKRAAPVSSSVKIDASKKSRLDTKQKRVKFNSKVESREISPRPNRVPKSSSSSSSESELDSDGDLDSNDEVFMSFDNGLEDDSENVDDEEGDFEDLEQDEEEDDEVNEFELDQERVGSQAEDEDEDMIGDDGEDLHAHLDGQEDDDDDSDEEEDDSDGDEDGDVLEGGAGLDRASEDDDGDEDDDDADADADDDDDDEGWSTVPSTSTVPLETPVKPISAKAAKRAAKQPKPLTAAELRALAFAELTASPISNVISTQVTSLLDPITPTAPSQSPIQPVLKLLHTHFVESLPQKPRSLASFEQSGLSTVPPVEGKKGKWGDMELKWLPPRAEDIRIVGRWAWGGGIKVNGEYIIDMAVGMPEELVEPRDYLSPRFSVKSTHYLLTLASSLPASLGPVSLSYAALGGAQGYALEIRSAHVKGTDRVGLSKARGAVIRVRVVWPDKALAHSKVGPLSNAVRPTNAISEASETSAASFPATPLHTTALHLSSLSLLTSHLKYHHALTTSNSSYAAAARLLQVWASRRSFGQSLGFTSEFWAWCVARTLGWGSRASESATSALGGEAWAVWRKAVEWLAGANWVDGIWFRAEGDKSYEKADWKKAFAGRPIFIDPTGTVNLAAGVELATLEMLKQDAKSTIALILARGDDERKFDSLFLQEVRPVERFDNFVRISIPPSRLAKQLDHDDSLDYADATSYLISSISSTLSRALGNRVKAFQIVAPDSNSIRPKEKLKRTSSIVLTCGLLLDATESGRLVDQGPSAEDESACAEFSSFWGPKSELRRFKDGTIVQSVVWDEPSRNGLGSQKNKVVGRVIEYILNHRHGIETVEVYSGATMDHLLVEPESLRRALYLEDAVTTGKGFSTLLNAYDALSKELKELTALPLGVSSVQPSTPGLRYSTTFMPSPRRLKDIEHTPTSTRYIEIHDIHLTLESSGRWPDDLEGIQKIKAAFLTKIGEQLESTRSVLMANVVFDLESKPVEDNVALEILMVNGFAFRARIHYDRSLLLLKERAVKLGTPFIKEASVLAYEERYVHSPRHHAAISTLQHHFPSYSGTVRLVKRWCSSHLLSHYIAPELLEILSASVFINSASPFEPPQSALSGFARVMSLLASWKWKDEPLYVPLYTFQLATTANTRPQFPPAQIAKVQALFESNRIGNLGSDVHAWIIATEEDLGGEVWGRGLGKVVAARVKGLAKATLKTMHRGVLGGDLVVESLFLPPMQDYDFLIHIDSAVNPRHFQSIAPESKALSWSRMNGSIIAGSVMGEVDDDDDQDEDDSMIHLGFDPVTRMVKDLTMAFPGTFMLFHSPSDSIIGGVFEPSMLGSKAFKVGLNVPLRPSITSISSSSAPAEQESSKPKVELDRKSLLRQLERIGRGLIKKTELIRE